MQVLSLDTGLGPLLVPVGIVAQIINPPERPNEAYDLFFIRSEVEWRDLKIPLVMSSEMLGMAEGRDNGFSRVVVLWPMKGASETDLIALSSLSSPRVGTISEDHASIAYKPPPGLCRNDMVQYSLGFIKLENSIGIIPDIEKLSKDIFDKN